jgi:hypothetical protein
MMQRVTAHAALEHIWRAMVELAESGNDAVVDGQRTPTVNVIRRITDGATDLATLAHAAAALARHCGAKSR